MMLSHVITMGLVLKYGYVILNEHVTLTEVVQLV